MILLDKLAATLLDRLPDLPQISSPDLYGHETVEDSLANGIRRDSAAVHAAFSRPENNGVTEGQVNRLKFLKRQMFGRAHLDLLRIKVLHAV